MNPDPRGIVIADLNEDGRADLAIADGTGSISVMLGNGDGSFPPGVTISVGALLTDLISGDWNGDGHVDLAASRFVPDLPPPGSILVLLGNGDGTFGTATEYPAGEFTLDVDSADLNSDGHPDLVGLNRNDHSISVFLGVGDGSFLPERRTPTEGEPFALALGDLNRDGRPDAVTSIYGSPHDLYSIFWGNGDGTFTPNAPVPQLSIGYGLEIADVTGDNIPDLVSTGFLGLTVFRNSGDGTLLSPRSYATADVPFRVALADLNADQIPDAAVLCQGFSAQNGAVSVFPGAADGTFGSRTDYASGDDVTALALGDVNGDARPDLVVTNRVPGILSIRFNLVNRAPTANPGGPYSGVPGVPVALDGSASSDPDGDALTYHWDFGDGFTATGATPSHTYRLAGAYVIALTVTDNGAPPLSGTATTAATITGTFPARVFTLGSKNKRIRVGGAKSVSTWCAEVEPLNGSYATTAVVASSLVMKYGGGQISALSNKTIISTDLDGNGIEEIAVCFRKGDFSSLGFPSGTNTVAVTIQGDLATGGHFSGDLSIEVVNESDILAASVSPNPLNPDATLNITVTKPGLVRVRLFDPTGRLVRTLMDEPNVTKGFYGVEIDGRDERGGRLSSGVYFYRVESSGGSISGSFVILK